MGLGKTERHRGRRWLQRQARDGEENVIDLRRNNVLDDFIFIYAYKSLYPKVLLLSFNFQNVQKVFHAPSGASSSSTSKILAEGGELGSDGWSGCL